MIVQSQTTTIVFDSCKIPPQHGIKESFKRTFVYKRLSNPPTSLTTWEVRVKEFNQLVGIVCQHKNPFYTDNYGHIKADRYYWMGYGIQFHMLPVIARTRKEATKKMYLSLD